MKKLNYLIALLVIAVFILVSCSPPPTPEAPAEEPAAPEEPAVPEEPEEVETEEPAEEMLEEPEGGFPDLGGAEITVAVEDAYPPFNYVDQDTGESKGWDYDVVAEICERINCVPKFTLAAWDGIFPAMEAGEFDMLADGVTITEERDKIIDYSIPYVTIGQVLFVRADETATVEEMKADEGALIGTQIQTTNEIVAKKNFPEERVQSFEDFGAATLALLSGDVDGVVLDTVAAVGFMNENPGDFKVAGELTSDEQLGFVFPPGSELTAAVDAALEEMIADGTLEEFNIKWGLEKGPEEEVAMPEFPDLDGAEITVAVEDAYPPFNYVDQDTGESKGWDYDVVAEICERINCVPVFTLAAWDGIFPAMEAGEFDMLADGVTITEERDKIIDYSIPYVTIGQVLFVRADETATVEEMKANDEALIGTQIQTTNEIVAKKNFPEERVQSFEDFGAATLALLSGDVDGVVLDTVAAVGFMNENPGDFKVGGELTSDEQLGFVFPPGSELTAAVDAALKSMMDDGTLAEFNAKWGLSSEDEEPAAVELPDLGGVSITVAVEDAYPPFNYVDQDSGESIGWDYDVVSEICVRINCVPEFTLAAWDGIFPAMEAGEFDMLADGVTITEERDKIIDYSIPYITIGQVLLVRADETASVDDIKADDGALIGTQIQTTNEIVAKKNFPEERVQSFEDFGAATLALLSGDVDGVVLDTVAAVGFMNENPGDFKVAGELTSDEQLGFVFPPGSELTAAVNAALESMLADGTLKEFNDKWGLSQ